MDEEIVEEWASCACTEGWGSRLIVMRGSEVG